MAALGLEDLAALNDEIVALVRAGLPLETGLTQFGRELPGRLGRISQAVGKRMEQGESLPVALEQLGPDVPDAYRAVVAAGLRAGRLPAALEGVARYARDHLDLRRTIERSAAYPLLILLLAYGLGLLFLTLLIPRLRDAIVALDVPEPAILGWLEALGSRVAFWGPILPALVVAALMLWIWLGRRRGLNRSALLDRLPKVGSILRLGRRSNFAGWLGLMVDQGVPLPEGLELAGSACGDSTLDQAARETARRLRLGQPMAEAGSALPAWLLHSLLAGMVTNNLPAALRAAALHDRRRATHSAEMLREWLPSVMLLFVGGFAVLLYALVLFLPWAALLNGVSRATP